MKISNICNILVLSFTVICCHLTGFDRFAVACHLLYNPL